MDAGFDRFSRGFQKSIVLGWPSHLLVGACPTRIASQAFARSNRSRACLVIRVRGSSRWCGAQKNCVQCLWASAPRLVRPKAAKSSRFVLRRYPRVPGVRGSACPVSKLRPGEARALGLVGRQPAVHEALRLAHRTPLSPHDRARRGRRVSPGLAHRQRAGQAVHAGTTGSDGYTCTTGHRYRRDLGAQGPRLSHRGQRPASNASNLVRRPGPQGEQHGAVLRVARAAQERSNSAGSHGHVAAVSQGHASPRAQRRDSVRQVPHPAPPGRRAGRSTQERIRKTVGN